VCAISGFALYEYPITGPLVKYSDQKILIFEANNIQETSIKVKTHKGFTTQVSLHSLVNDKASDNGLILEITVCGLETLKAT